MSRTKVKKNVIDATFGNILEQIIYRADGRTITTEQGNITVPTAASQNTTSSSSCPLFITLKNVGLSSGGR